MARYKATVTSPASCEAVFDYLADFRSAAEWDPGVCRARSLPGRAGTPGAEFEMTSRFIGRDVPLIYRTSRSGPPTARLLMVAESSTVISRDEITLAEITDGRTAVTY